MQFDTQIGLRAFRTLEDDIRSYCKSYFFVMFASHGLASVLFNLYMLRLGLAPETIGIVNGTALVVLALLALPAGLLGRRVPIGTIMRWSVLLASLCSSADGSAGRCNTVRRKELLKNGTGQDQRIWQQFV